MRRMQADELRQPAHQRLDVVLARHVHAVLAVQLRRPSARRRKVAISCSMNSGWPSSRTRTRPCLREFDDLLRHQRIDDVQREDRQAARAERVGEAERAQRASAVVEPALHDDADVLGPKDLVQRFSA